MIKFLRDYQTRSVPPEIFSAGQEVAGRDRASELHFVTRGIAAFVDGEGNLTDAEGRPMTAAPTAEVVNVSANRDGDVGRAGETLLDDGTPQRGSPGPGSVMSGADSLPGADSSGAPPADLPKLTSGMTKANLLAIAGQESVTVADSATNDEIRAAIEAKRAAA